MYIMLMVDHVSCRRCAVSSMQLLLFYALLFIRVTLFFFLDAAQPYECSILFFRIIAYQRRPQVNKVKDFYYRTRECRYKVETNFKMM